MYDYEEPKDNEGAKVTHGVEDLREKMKSRRFEILCLVSAVKIEPPEPIDLDLDLSTRTIYWTDRGDNTVSRGAMGGGPREILLSGMTEAIGMSLDLHRGRLAYTSLNGEIGFADLDGTALERHQLSVRPLTGAAWHP